MKKIKWLMGFLVFMLCFVLGSELSQSYLSSFTNRFYYLDIVALEEREQLYDILSDVAGRFEVPIFAVKSQIKSARASDIIIYADENTLGMLEKKCEIKKGTYRSFFTGETNVVGRNFDAIISHSDVERYYFDTSAEQMEQIHYYINRHIATSYVHKEDISGLEWVMNGIWSIPFLFLLTMTWFAIQFDKKKNFLRVSLGVSKLRIVFRSLVTDILVFVTEFVVVYWILNRYIYIKYHFHVVILLFICFLVINSVLHFSFMKYRYKEILYGANRNQSLLSNCYLMKAATLILTIAALTVNVYLIYNNVKYLRFYPVIQSYDKECFVNVSPDFQYYKANATELLADDESGMEFYDKVYQTVCTKMMSEYLYQDKLKYSLLDLDDDEGHYICFLNDESVILTDKLKEKIDEDVDICFLCPKDFPTNFFNETEAMQMIEWNLGLPQGTYTYKWIPYDFKSEVLYMDIQEGAGLEYGFEVLKSPALIYCNISGDKIRKIHEIKGERVDDMYFSMLMFTEEESESLKLSQKYHLSECSLITVPKQFENIKNSMLRIVLMNTMISLFMLVLELAIILTIIRLEYIVNAKVLSVKKILGYPVWRKNISIFGLNAFAAFIGTITNVIIALMFGVAKWNVAAIIGLALVGIESLIMLINIERFERVNIAKILKGGSL